MTPKDSAREFLQLASSGRVREAYDRFVAPRTVPREDTETFVCTMSGR